MRTSDDIRDEQEGGRERSKPSGSLFGVLATATTIRIPAEAFEQAVEDAWAEGVRDADESPNGRGEPNAASAAE
jgi:hypothetical protein